MTKSELIAAFAKEIDVSNKQARNIVDTILDSMTDALSRGEGIEL